MTKIKRINFPTFTLAERLKLICDSKCDPISPEDTDFINEGNFVLVWNKDNVADDYPLVGALKSVTISRFGKCSYTVMCDDGSELAFKHAIIISSKKLPMVIAAKSKGEEFAVLGKFVGCFKDVNEDIVCTIECRDDVFHIEAEKIAYYSDVKFGITEQNND